MVNTFAADLLLSSNKDLMMKGVYLESSPKDVVLCTGASESHSEQLASNEKKFRALVTNAIDAVAIIDLKGKPSYISPSVTEILGYSVEEILNIELSDILHPDDAAAVGRKLKECSEKPGVRITGQTSRLKHKDGSWRWIEATLTNCLSDPDINGIIDSFRDVTDRIVANERLATLTHLHSFISRINKAVVQAPDELAVFKEVYTVATQLGNFKAAWITLIHPGLETIEIIEGAEIFGDYAEQFNEIKYNDAYSVNTVGKTRKYYLCDDVLKEFAHDVRGAFSAAYGIGSFIILPIIKDEAIYATLTLCAVHVGYFTPEVIELLIKAAEDISVGIQLLAADKARREQELLLYKKKQKLKQIQSIANVGSWEYDLATNHFHWSDEALAIYELPLTNSSIQQEAWLQLVHPEDVAFVSKLIAEANRNLADVEFDHRIITKTGSIKYIHAKTQFQFNAVGEPIGIIGAVHDITFIKEAEKRIRDSEIFNKGILNSLNYQIAVVDQKGFIRSVNKAWKTFTEANGDTVSQSNSVGSNYFDVCRKAADAGDEIAVQVLDGISSVFRRETPVFELEYPCDSPDEKRWFVLNATLLGTDEAKVVVSHKDISEIKLAQLALKETESNLKAIFDNTKDGFVLLDVEGRIKAFNNIAKESTFLNVTAALEVGESIFRYVEEKRHDDFRQIFSKCLKGEAISYDRPYIRENSETKWFNFTLSPVVIDSHIQGVCIAGTDITERLEIQQTLAASESKHRLLSEQLSKERGQLVEAQTIAKLGSWEMDLVEMRATESEEMYRIYDIEPGTFESYYKDILPFTHPDDQELMDAVFKASLAKPGLYTHEHRIITRKGTEKHLLEKWRVVHNRAGRPVKAIASCQDITEQKMAELDNRFKAMLLNTIGQSVIATDQNGIVNYWNKAAENIYGWTAEEAIGRSIAILTPAQSSIEQGKQIMNDLRSGKTWSGEFPVQRKDGTVFPAFVTDSPIYDESNNLVGIIGVSSDISEQKALQQLVDRASSIARIGAWDVDVPNNILFWSPMTKEIHEIAPDVNPDLASAINYYKEGESRNLMQQAFKNALEKHTPFDLELQIVTAKGNERWVRAIGEVEVVNGVCTRAYGSFQDIHARKSAEIEASSAYQERNMILESIGDAFFAVDKKWTVTYWSNKAEVLLRTGKDDILNKNLWHVFPDAIGSDFHEKYHQVMRDGTATQFEACYDTFQMWFDVSVYPTPNGLSVFFKDVTSRKQLETERATMLSDIIQRNKDLEQFSYIVSHNLRAPVANIIGVTGELNQENQPIEIKELFLKQLALNVARLDNVIVDLNEILKVKQEVNEQKEYVDFDDLVYTIKGSISRLVHEQGVVIKTDFKEVGIFQTLKSYIYSVFYNLISNSIKYRKPDVPPVIEISSAIGNGKLVLTFQDNGTGIDLEKKGEQVFGLYKRFHKNIEGKGMGLFMVKTQVETLGGKITISSKPNEGARFEITFPLIN